MSADVMKKCTQVRYIDVNIFQVEVMKEAAKYIDQLQNSLICRIRTHGFPEKLKSAAADTAASNDDSGESIKSAVQTYLVKNNKWT